MQCAGVEEGLSRSLEEKGVLASDRVAGTGEGGLTGGEDVSIRGRVTVGAGVVMS